MKFAFPIITIVLVLISFIASREKTLQAAKIALKKFVMVLPPFISVILLMSVIVGFVSPDMIKQVLGSEENRWIAAILAAGVGAIAIMPGFVAFPLAGILQNNGVPYMVISAFTTTLMMVGIVTFPLEKAFFGTKVALLRNILGFMIALIVAIGTAFFFGELSF